MPLPLVLSATLLSHVWRVELWSLYGACCQCPLSLLFLAAHSPLSWLFVIADTLCYCCCCLFFQLLTGIGMCCVVLCCVVLCCPIQGKHLFLRLDEVADGLMRLRSGSMGFPAEAISARAVDDAIDAAEALWSAITALAESQVRAAHVFPEHLLKCFLTTCPSRHLTDPSLPPALSLPPLPSGTVSCYPCPLHSHHRLLCTPWAIPPLQSTPRYCHYHVSTLYPLLPC